MNKEKIYSNLKNEYSKTWNIIKSCADYDDKKGLEIIYHKQERIIRIIRIVEYKLDIKTKDSIFYCEKKPVIKLKVKKEEIEIKNEKLINNLIDEFIKLNVKYAFIKDNEYGNHDIYCSKDYSLLSLISNRITELSKNFTKNSGYESLDRYKKYES